MTKRCNKCGEVKPLSDFCRYSRSADGHYYRCKSCVSADKADPEYRARDNARRRAQYQDRPDARRASSKRWYENNKDAHFARINRWRKDNPDRVKEYAEAFKQRHPGYKTEWTRRQKAEVTRWYVAKVLKVRVRDLTDEAYEKKRQELIALHALKNA